MAESIEWLRLLITHHRSLEYVIIFLGAALGGEVALFILGFLAAQGVVSILSVFILSFAGSLFPNILWFLLGKTTAVSRIALHRYANTTISIITQAVGEMSKRNHIVALTIIKFLVGTPFILIMYVNKTNISFRKFVYFESIALILSLLVIVPIGFASGFGFTYLAEIFNNLYVAIGFILLVLIVVIISQLWLKKRFTNQV